MPKNKSLLNNLIDKNLIHPPKFLANNTQYLVMMGSFAYGCSSDNSDMDIYGFTLPRLDMIFPNLKGSIIGFTKDDDYFEQWQEAHVIDKETDKEYDFSIYSIVKYFRLCLDNNPNMLDSLFVPQNCILHSTEIGNMVREKRKLFIHKGLWPKYKGYSYSQMKKIKTKTPKEGSKRWKDVQLHKFDSKFAYHLYRLLDEAEQLLTTGDMDLQRGKEVMKAIRNGDWTEQDLYEYFDKKEKELETAYANSTLPWGPKDHEEEIKQLLLNCIEHHYGSLDKAIVLPDKYENALIKIKEICNNVGIY